MPCAFKCKQEFQWVNYLLFSKAVKKCLDYGVEDVFQASEPANESVNEDLSPWCSTSGGWFWRNSFLYWCDVVILHIHQFQRDRGQVCLQSGLDVLTGGGWGSGRRRTVRWLDVWSKVSWNISSLRGDVLMLHIINHLQRDRGQVCFLSSLDVLTGTGWHSGRHLFRTRSAIFWVTAFWLDNLIQILFCCLLDLIPWF